MTKHPPRRRGQSLVELALVALVLYLLLAATVDLGRATLSVQVIEDAARVAARELALMPFPPTGVLTRDALETDLFRARVFDPNWLVIDLDDLDAAGVALEELRLPPVNEQLRPLFVLELVGGRRLLRYPGALILSPYAHLPASASPPVTPSQLLTVRIPRVRYDAGGETIYDWVDVVEPAAADDPSTAPVEDPFPITGAADPRQGLAALRVNYPFQAATIGNFRETSADPFDANVSDAVVADDAGVLDTSTDAPASSDFIVPDASTTGASPVSGRYGLGKQLALDQELRPFRRVQTAQAVFRREIFGN